MTKKEFLFEHDPLAVSMMLSELFREGQKEDESEPEVVYATDIL